MASGATRCSILAHVPSHTMGAFASYMFYFHEGAATCVLLQAVITPVCYFTALCVVLSYCHLTVLLQIV